MRRTEPPRRREAAASARPGRTDLRGGAHCAPGVSTAGASCATRLRVDRRPSRGTGAAVREPDVRMIDRRQPALVRSSCASASVGDHAEPVRATGTRPARRLDTAVVARDADHLPTGTTNGGVGNLRNGEAQAGDPGFRGEPPDGIEPSTYALRDQIGGLVYLARPRSTCGKASPHLSLSGVEARSLEDQMRTAACTAM
jgi:hypothetical protein